MWPWKTPKMAIYQSNLKNCQPFLALISFRSWISRIGKGLFTRAAEISRRGGGRTGTGTGGG